MVSKKVLFVIVEGPSDATALKYFLEHRFASESLYMYIVYGDVTTDSASRPDNIVSVINGYVTDTIKKEPAFRSKQDFARIVHIVDSDGAFVDDALIKEFPGAKRFIYGLDGILVPDREMGIERNARKRANLGRLIGCDAIGGIPYSVYYMSSNLDHVLYNKLNSGDIEKRRDAVAFNLKYKDDIDRLAAFFEESSFSICDGYRESWEYLKEGNNSLLRGTNIALSWRQRVSG